jgi:predicted transcriptional regulator
MAKRSFSFMLDEELRARAERIAKVLDRSLGWLVTLALEEKVATLDAEHPPTPTRRARKPVT